MSDVLKKRARERELEKIRGKANGRTSKHARPTPRPKPAPAVDDDPEDANTAHNLELYAMNTGELYNARKDIARQLLRAKRSHDYHRPSAVSRWDSWLRKAARMYGREFQTGPGRYGYGPFDPKVIRQAAERVADWFEATSATGELDYLLEP